MTRPTRLNLDLVASPLGQILLVTDEDGTVRALDFHDYAPRMTRLLRLHYGVVALEEGVAPAATRKALSDYFEAGWTPCPPSPGPRAGPTFSARSGAP